MIPEQEKEFWNIIDVFSEEGLLPYSPLFEYAFFTSK